MFLVYKGYEIISSGDNFRIKTPNAGYLQEVAASVATAKKWIDALVKERSIIIIDVAEELDARGYIADIGAARDAIERNIRHELENYFTDTLENAGVTIEHKEQ